MGNIGGAIVNGALGALWSVISHVPLTLWLILFVALCAVIAVMRVATNWKVDLVLIAIAGVIAVVIYYREHWIHMGYARAQAQVEAYKKTNALIIACYDRDPAAHVWDRSQGKCLRRDGAIE